MSKKTDITAKLLAKIQPQHPLPQPLPEANLLEQGLYAILLRRIRPEQALDTIQRLRAAYKDWNELRISQSQEIGQFLDLGDQTRVVALDIREYLQEVFQRSHGMELEFLRDDSQGAQRFVSILPFIGMGTAHYLLWLASNHELPVTPALMRVLDRLGLASRTASPKKARAAIEPIVPKGEELDFAVRFGEVASRWCDARKPICHECVLVDDCKFGKKAYKDWKVQQERQEQMRVREEARLAVIQKKEDEKRRKEDEKRKKKDALEAEKRARETARLAKIAEKKRSLEAEKQAKLKAVADAKAKAEAERQRQKKEVEQRKLAAVAEAKRKAEAAAKEAERKKVEAKKLAEKKALEHQKEQERKALALKKAKEKAAEKAAADKAAAAAKKAALAKKAAVKKPAPAKKKAKKR
ncbi:MAG: hypothetical protein NTV21_13705 [Planctomycetota bacterium]|nr:hypothetical protein [Planctomycetota bacterium]